MLLPIENLPITCHCLSPTLIWKYLAFPCSFHCRHTKFACSERQKKLAYFRVCVWTSFSSWNTVLLRCHKNLSLFFSLKIVVAFSEMHSLITHPKLKAIHQLLFITLFISFLLGSSMGWTEFVNVCIYLLPNVKSSLLCKIHEAKYTFGLCS